jgi:LysR family transcriptional regulator, carnitine catabolism transcriptional activator
MRIPVNLRQLEAFVAVASCGNFSQAALSLHVSQPALSRTIQMAEDALGARLFDRNTRTVRLTAAGSELLLIARRILAEFDESLGSLSQFIKGHRGQINVSALPSMGALLASAIPQFCVDRPDVGFMVRLEPDAGVLAALSQGVADIGITAQPPPEGEFRYQHLVDDDYLLLCRSDDALGRKEVIRSPVGWGVFQKHPYIASAKGTSIRRAADQVFIQLGLEVRPAHESTSLPIAGAFVAAGLGISVIPATAFALLDQRALVARPLKAPKVTRQIGIVTRAGHSLSSVALAFVDHLAGVVPATGNLLRPR